MSAEPIKIHVRLWSYFAELAQTASLSLELAEGSTVGDAIRSVGQQYPPLAGAEKCTLAAVGVDYAPTSQVLQPGDELSLFPPVQGG